MRLKDSKFYQASTSELYGKVAETPQRETTPFYPRSPYGVAKLYAYWITVNYREAYGLYAANGILFNHESPVRGETFVTRKITRAVAAIELGSARYPLYRQPRRQARLGPRQGLRQRHVAHPAAAEARRLRARHRREPSACVNSSSSPSRKWDAPSSGSGSGDDEVGVDNDSGQVLVKIDRRYFRPTEVDVLHGDASKAKRELGWEAETTFTDLVAEMVKSDLELLGKDPNAVARLNY